MSKKICPFCAEQIQQAAVKCRYCGSMLGQRPEAGDWYRDLDGKMIGGVCSGLAKQFGVAVTALRIAFIIATCAGGWGILIYVALWIIMPVKAHSKTAPLPEGTAQDQAPPAKT